MQTCQRARWYTRDMYKGDFRCAGHKGEPLSRSQSKSGAYRSGSFTNQKALANKQIPMTYNRVSTICRYPLAYVDGCCVSLAIRR